MQAGSVDSGNLNLAGNLNAGNQILLQASNGVSQTGGIITTSELLLGGDAAIESTGVFDLANDNVVDQLAFDILGTLNFNNVGDFEVTSLAYDSASGSAEDETITNSSATDKIRLTADGTIGLDTGVSSETVFIEATDGVIQTGGQVLSTNLLLSGTGLFQLASVTNDTDNLAADIDGTLDYFDADDLTLAELSCDGITITGLNVTGDATISTDDGDLHQDSNAPIIVGGTTTIDVGTANICLIFGDNNSDSFNDNDLNRLIVASATTIEFVDSDEVEVGGVSAIERIRIESGNVTTGGTVITGDLTAAEQILLQSSGGITQTEGVLNASDLIVSGTGSFDLFNQNLIGDVTNAGKVSVQVTGDFAFQNLFGIALDTLTFDAKQGPSITNTTFGVGGDLTLFGNHNDLAIFDVVDINVAGEAWLVASTANGSIVADQLNVTGAIGVETVGGDATLVNNNSNGFLLRGDDQPGVDSSEANFHFEVSSVVGNLSIQATAGDITNENDASLFVSETLQLTAGTTNASNVASSNNEFDVILGNQVNDFFDVDTLQVNSQRASIQLDADVVVSDTYIGSFSGSNLINGTIVLSNTGSIVQADGADLISDQAGFVSDRFIFLNNLTANRLAANAFGDTDVTTLSNVPEELPTDPQDAFAPRFNDIDTGYGIVVVNQGDLIIGSVRDALEIQPQLQGFFSDAGHVYFQTNSLGSESGDILFTGDDSVINIGANGLTFGVAGNVNSGHAITTIAAGDLTIDTNTILVSSTGAVTDISSFTTPEGRNSTNVTLEGPFMSLFLPTADDNPTTRTVGSDNTQFIGLNIGRNGEQRFLVEANFADGVTEVFDFATDVGPRFERISRTFDPFFLFTVLDLPTELTVFNDPGINLFDNGGNENLNSSATDLNSSANFVSALSGSRPQGDVTLASIEIDEPIAVERDPVVVSPFIDTSVNDFEFEEEFIVDEESDSKAELFFVDDNNEEVKIKLISENETITPDVIAQWREKVDAGIEFPPGKYRFKWTDNGVPFAVEFTKFVDENVETLDGPEPDLVDSEETENESEGEVRLNAPTEVDSKDDQDITFPLESNSTRLPQDFLTFGESQESNSLGGRRLEIATSVAALALTRIVKGKSLRSSIREENLNQSTKNHTDPEVEKHEEVSFSKLARTKRRLRSGN